MVKEEADLVEQAKAGSRQAFSKILRLHQAQMRAFLSRYVQDEDVVEDLAQDTFLIVYHDLASYRGESSLRTWILGIARHRALRHLQESASRRLREATTLGSWLVSRLIRRVEDNPSSAVRHEEELSALDQCLKGLPERSSKLVAGFYYERHSTADLAQRTGQTESAVRMSLMRVRQALRRCIEFRVAAAGSGHE